MTGIGQEAIMFSLDLAMLMSWEAGPYRRRSLMDWSISRLRARRRRR